MAEVLLLVEVLYLHLAVQHAVEDSDEGDLEHHVLALVDQPFDTVDVLVSRFQLAEALLLYLHFQDSRESLERLRFAGLYPFVSNEAFPGQLVQVSFMP
jgi:hypothetical protein